MAEASTGGCAFGAGGCEEAGILGGGGFPKGTTGAVLVIAGGAAAGSWGGKTATVVVPLSLFCRGCSAVVGGGSNTFGSCRTGWEVMVGAGLGGALGDPFAAA
jgi:hypothetical protein